MKTWRHSLLIHCRSPIKKSKEYSNTLRQDAYAMDLRIAALKPIRAIHYYLARFNKIEKAISFSTKMRYWRADILDPGIIGMIAKVFVSVLKLHVVIVMSRKRGVISLK